MDDRRFSTQLRALLCERCGAPLSVAFDGGAVACGYCSARNVVSARPRGASASGAGVSLDVRPSESAALLDGLDAEAKARAEASIAHLILGPALNPAKIDEAFATYQLTRQEVARSGRPAAHQRLLRLTLLIADDLGAAGEEERRRALLETSLELLTAPPHRQVVLCLLAIAAVHAHEVESAEQWLAPCDPASDDLDAASAFRHARALLDTVAGDHDQVLRRLGGSDGAVPIARRHQAVCALMRANALERKGRLEDAVAVLRHRMAEEPGMGRRAMAAHVRRHAWLDLCPMSLPKALELQTRAAVEHSSVLLPLGRAFVGFGIAILALALTSIAVLLVLDPRVALDGWILVVVGAGFYVPGRLIRDHARLAAELRTRGVEFTGEVVSVEGTSSSTNGFPVKRVTASVIRPDGSYYRASFTQTAEPSVAQELVPGRTIALRVHPELPDLVAMEAM